MRFSRSKWFQKWNLQNRHFILRRAEDCWVVLGTALVGRHAWMLLFGALSASGRGTGTIPSGIPHLWRINVIPLHTNWQFQAPLGETDTETYRQELKTATPLSSLKTIWLSQNATDCPCQSPLVRYVAQLWLLNQTTICNTARRFCRNADLKWREQSLWTARHRGADISRKCF